jgi:hypothetical protein
MLTQILNLWSSMSHWSTPNTLVLSQPRTTSTVASGSVTNEYGSQGGHGKLSLPAPACLCAPAPTSCCYARCYCLLMWGLSGMELAPDDDLLPPNDDTLLPDAGDAEREDPLPGTVEKTSPNHTPQPSPKVLCLSSPAPLLHIPYWRVRPRHITNHSIHIQTGVPMGTPTGTPMGTHTPHSMCNDTPSDDSSRHGCYVSV